MWFCDVPFNFSSLLIVPGLFTICANGAWIAILFGMIGARFRDVQPLVGSVLQIAFFVTPIFWQAQLVSGSMADALVNYNVLFHFIEIVRLPMLGQAPGAYSWIMVIGSTVIGWWVTMYMFSRFRRRVPYWL